MENIRHLKAHERLHYFFDSITNQQLLAELVDESDVMFHLAAAVGVRLIVESPVRTIETNVNGTQLVLDAASKKKKLVFTASTSEVYGKSDKVPFHEDADLVLGPTTKGRWSYAASKALDEFLALSYWKEEAAGDRGSAVQHRRDRDKPGDTEWCCRISSGRRWRAPDHGFRLRAAVALLLRRSRHDGGNPAADRQRPSRGRSREYRQR